jgi:HD-GYP domain-containing protein (c-di-GMP phosphodiesterase class II)
MQEKFRISDIFKKSKEEKKPPAQGIRFFPPKPEKIEKSKKQSPDKVSFSSIVSKQPEGINNIEANALYSEAVSYAQQIYKGIADESHIAKGTYALVKRIVDSISVDNQELLKAALAKYPHPEGYLYYHVVNVCIFSLYLGQGLVYDGSHLVELGVFAFLHDMGISRYLDIINQPKRLSPQEYSDIKQHPLIGPQILDKIGKDLNLSVFEVIRQEHERIDGSGYPKGLKDDQIIEYAQIVGLTDVYEAMIHQRPYRDRYTSLEAIKAILTDKNNFAHRLVKILIERIGIFPIGTFVQLNTREIGQVLRGNLELPLRPVVNIIFDSTGKRLKQSRQIDLADSPTVYILGTSSMPIEPVPF